MTWGDTVVCGGRSATAAEAPLPATANDIPAIPNAGTALLRRFPFEARFACDIAGLLFLLLVEQMFDDVPPGIWYHFSRAVNSISDGRFPP